MDLRKEKDPVNRVQDVETMKQILQPAITHLQTVCSEVVTSQQHLNDSITTLNLCMLYTYLLITFLYIVIDQGIELDDSLPSFDEPIRRITQAAQRVNALQTAVARIHPRIERIRDIIHKRDMEAARAKAIAAVGGPDDSSSGPKIAKFFKWN